MYKFNKAENAEVIHVTLTEEKYPIFFNQKVEELVEEFNISEEDARMQVEGMDFALELCYYKGFGLFAIESEAIELNQSGLFNPYSGEEIEESDEESEIKADVEGLKKRFKDLVKEYGKDGVLETFDSGILLDDSTIDKIEVDDYGHITFFFNGNTSDSVDISHFKTNMLFDYEEELSRLLSEREC